MQFKRKSKTIIPKCRKGYCEWPLKQSFFNYEVDLSVPFIANRLKKVTKNSG